MCGIYGITASDQHFINEYMHICKHRGPDGGSKIEIVNKFISKKDETAEKRKNTYEESIDWYRKITTDMFS